MLRRMDSNVDPPRVIGLNVFPIKSCKAIRKTEIEFDAYGVAGDRRFMMINGNGRLLAQRQAPIMATVTANFTMEKGKRYLCARAPSMTWDLKFEPILEGPRIDATVWDSHIRVIDQGEVPAKWFNELLGCQSTNNRLVASAETSREGEMYEREIWNLPSGVKNRLNVPQCSVEGTGHETSVEVGLADSAPVSLVSQESLEDLNTRMAESGAYEVPLNRFRMNIEIAGCSRPYEEDEWVRVRVGEVPFLIYRDSERCKMTGVDQETGEVDKVGPLDVLRTYRAPKGPLHAKFGQLMIPLQRTGKVRVGDTVQILERKK